MAKLSGLWEERKGEKQKKRNSGLQKKKTEREGERENR